MLKTKEITQYPGTLSLLAFLVSPAISVAQEPKGIERMEEIVVTAQKREANIQDVPMSIIAIGSEQLEQANVDNIHDLGQISPGVQVDLAGAFTQPTIRGVTTLTNGNQVENNVAIYVDGFYEPNPLIVNMGLENIESIEVLKGPQGALYGRNATGGAILFNTKSPSQTLEGKLSASYGRFDDQKLSGYISGPISDNWRYSVSAHHRESDGWIDYIGSNGEAVGDASPIEEEALRVKLQADLSDNLQATLGYTYALSDIPHGLMFSPLEHEAPFLPPESERPSELGEATYNYGVENSVTLNQATLKLDWNTSIGTLKSYTSYAQNTSKQEFDFDGTLADLTSFESEFNQEVFQQSVDYNIEYFDDINMTLGGMYYGDNHNTDPNTGISIFLANRSPLFINQVKNDTDAFAAYIDADYHVTDKLSIGLGGRYSIEERTSFFSSVTPAGAYVFPPTEKEEDYDQFTWSASSRYQLTEDANIYASYSKGFRSGYFNPSGAPTPDLWQPLKPEIIDAYEIGVKGTGTKYRYSGAVFYYDYQDLHVQTTGANPNCPPAEPNCQSVTLFQNAPKAEIYGVDGEVTIRPIERLNLRVGFAWLHARYEELGDATGTGLDASTGTNVTNQSQDWSGQETARSPEITVNMGVDYEFVLDKGNLIVSGNLSYSDSYVVNNPSVYGLLAGEELADKQRYRQDSMTLVNARATWVPSQNYSFSVFGSNLTDEEYRMAYSGSGFGDYSTQARPLSYGFELNYQF